MKLINLSNKEFSSLKSLSELKQNNIRYRFKLRSYHYGYSYGSPYLRVDLEQGLIKAQIIENQKAIAKAELEKFLTWVNKNTSEHKIKVYAETTGTPSRVITDGKLPKEDGTYIVYRVSGYFVLSLSDKQRDNIQKILDQRKEQKAKDRAYKAAARKRDAAARKKEAVKELALEQGDVAYALAILKKNGLKVVSIKEN